MAGDWIPLRVDLADDPAVILVAGRLGIDEFSVVGRLHHLWSWANRQLESGNAHGVTVLWVDRYVGVSGFAEALREAGWLVVGNGGLEFPKFERWNSKSAKRRLLTAQRVKLHRNAHCNASGVTKALPEKRREEKKEEYPPTPQRGEEKGTTPAYEHVDTNLWVEFSAAWAEAKLPGWDKSIQRTPSRVGLLQQRLAADDWRLRWREAIARAGLSVKLRGLDPSWPSGLRLDTFLKDPDMLVRILEGEFDDAPIVGNGRAAKRDAEIEAVIAKGGS